MNAVAGLPKQRLDEALDQLVRSELMFRRGEIPNAVYTFKHALVRDAAYAGLLKSRRVYLHAAIAKAIQQKFPEVVRTQPEIVAYHYTQARNFEKALHYWYEAGKQSAARSAHNEAVGHLKHFYAAEIYRLLSETYLRSNQNLDQAEHYFCRGLEVAREQKAKSFELRVCLSMCDLYGLRPDADKCRSQLGEIYGSFVEGFDTPDLVRAKARLESSW